jgi:MFS family permease
MSVARALTLFAAPGFFRLWLIGLLTGIVRWLEMLAIGVYVFDITGSAFHVALYSIARMVPLALFGAAAGALADRFDKKSTLAIVLCIVAAGSLTLAMLTLSGELELWHVAVGAFVSGILWSIDYPVRRTMLSVMAPRDQIASAIAFDSCTNAGTKALGPATGGLALALLGLDGVYFTGLGLYALSLLLLWPVARPASAVRAAAAAAENFWQTMSGAMTTVRRDRALKSSLLVAVIFNLFGFPYTAMVPVVGRGDLALDPFTVGLLLSGDGVGALLVSLGIAFLATNAMLRRLYVYGLMTSLFAMLAFAFTSHALPASVAVFAVGLGAGCYSAIQTTIIILTAPPESRGRLMGLMVVCIGMAPIGFAHVGLLAEWLGASMAVGVIAVEGIIALTLVRLIWPEVTSAPFSDGVERRA